MSNYPHNESIFYNQHVPYYASIPNDASPGTLILIYGRVPDGADNFRINFMVGHTSVSEHKRNTDDIAFHFNARFSNRTVVTNARKNTKWGPEERSDVMPFTTGREFEMMILIDTRGYKVAVNGTHFLEFEHRIPLSTVGMLGIEGDIKINRIEYRREIRNSALPVAPPINSAQNGQGYAYGQSIPIQPGFVPTANQPGLSIGIGPSCPPMQMQMPQPNPYGQGYGQGLPPNIQICPPGPISSPPPALNPPLPYRQPIIGGLRPGMMIYVSGKPSMAADRFAINFIRGTSGQHRDIAFHFNVRHHERAVVRNSCIGYDGWQNEERHVPTFPFFPGTNFDMIIRVDADKYMVAVNGQHFIEFKHRLSPIRDINMFEIEGDVVISSVRYI